MHPHALRVQKDSTQIGADQINASRVRVDTTVMIRPCLYLANLGTFQWVLPLAAKHVQQASITRLVRVFRAYSAQLVASARITQPRFQNCANLEPLRWQVLDFVLNVVTGRIQFQALQYAVLVLLGCIARLGWVLSFVRQAFFRWALP